MNHAIHAFRAFAQYSIEVRKEGKYIEKEVMEKALSISWCEILLLLNKKKQAILKKISCR